MLSIAVFFIILLFATNSFVLYKFIIAKSELTELSKKYKLNPDYDSQLILADLLSGEGLFRIERVERENLFYLRR